MAPFSDRLGSLVKSNVESDLTGPRSRGSHSLTSVPKVPEQAWGCHAEYLSGTASWLYGGEETYREQQPGDIIYNNPRDLHGIKTQNESLLALYLLR